MATTSTNPPDLGALARPARERGGTTIPRPPSRWKTRILVPLLVLGAAGGLLLYTARESLWPATEVRAVAVVTRTVQETAPAAREGGEVVAQAAGWVEADPYPISVSALTDGVVAEVLVLEGEAVKAGQVVARLIDDEARLALQSAEATVQEREGEVAAAAAALAEARAELARLPAEVAVEEARLAELVDERARIEQALARQSATESEATQARLRVRTQEAVLAATRARRGVLEARVRQREAEVEAARAMLARAAAARDEASLRFERTEIRAPVDGIVMERLAEPGTKLIRDSDDPHSAWAVRLYDPSRLQVRVDVPLSEAARIGVGQPASVAVEVLPERPFRGEVTRIAHRADIQKNTLQVKVRIEDPAPALRPEMLARVRFFGAPSAGAAGATTHRVLAPRGALVEVGRDAADVWVIDRTRHVAERRRVRLGAAAADGWVEVLEGLNPGDLLVSEPPEGLADGQPVRIAAATSGEGR